MDSLALVHGLSGILGGCSAMAVTYPLLTVTTRQQVRSEEDKGPLVALWNIITKEGFGSLYSGIGPALFGVSATMGVYIYSYEHIKRTVEQFQGRSLNVLENLLVGYIAGAINTTLTCPIWRVTTRMQARKGKSESPLIVARAIYSESGIVGFWKGLGASLVLCINPAIQWMVYEQLLKVVLRIRKSKTPSTFEIFILGAIGKIAATLITYPYIIVKSRMQAETTVTRADGPKRVGTKDEELQFRYKGVIDAFFTIVKKEGLVGLYSGLQSKLFQSVSNAAFMFLFKERFVQLTIFLLRIFLAPKTKTKAVTA